MSIRLTKVAGLCLYLLLPLAALANDGLRQRIEALQAGYSVEAASDPIMARVALARFYGQRNYALAWTLTDDRDSYLAVLETVGNAGLDAADYHVEALRQLHQGVADKLTAAQRVDRDLLFTDSFLLLASHLLEGKVNPETIDAEWLANRRQRLIEPLLADALEKAAIATTLNHLQPQQSGYARLLRARAEMASLASMTWDKLPAGASLKPGATDNRVPALRERLQFWGDLEPGVPVESPFYYDAVLVDSVKAFQNRHGLEPDGVVGSATLNTLNVSAEQRLKQIDVNLERWRWLPDDLGESHILVNIAGFELTLVRQQEVQQRYRVIVGRPFRRTPVFSDKIRYLVFNPTWTVPRTLLIEDKIPEIISDPSYLQRLGFRVYKGWGEGKTEVSPDSIEWASVSRRNFPFQLVQEPGPQNALGQVKFMFPNKFDVYLHDTPARDLFNKTERSFSSGCIRVENPLELAAVLLNGMPDWNRERIQRTVQERALTTVYLKKPMPVHMQYWTAWVDDGGRLQFRKDLYERDLRLQQALYSHLPPTSS